MTLYASYLLYEKNPSESALTAAMIRLRDDVKSCGLPMKPLTPDREITEVRPLVGAIGRTAVFLFPSPGEITLACFSSFAKELISNLEQQESKASEASPPIPYSLKSILHADAAVLDTVRITSEQIVALEPYLEGIYSVAIGSWEKQNDTLSVLKRMKRLEFLSLGPHPVTKEEAVFIGSASRLRSLRLGESKVSDEGLTALKGLQHLEELSLRRNPLGEEGVKVLANMPKLISLGLSGTGISDQSAGVFRDLKELRYLYLNDTKVSNETLKTLSGLPHLRLLALKHTAIDDSGAELLSTFKNLKEVSLSGTKVPVAMKDNLRAIGIKVDE